MITGSSPVRVGAWDGVAGVIAPSVLAERYAAATGGLPGLAGAAPLGASAVMIWFSRLLGTGRGSPAMCWFQRGQTL